MNAVSLLAFTLLTAWPHRAPVEVPEPAALVSVRLTRDAYDHSLAHFHDLRVLAPDGREQPYLLRESRASSSRVSVPVRILDRVRTPGGALQFVLDFGAGHGPHNHLRFETRDTQFRRALRIESSTDAARWDFLRAGAVVLLVEDGRRIELLDISYATSTRRYLRVTIEDWSDPEALTGVSALRVEETPAEWEVLATARPRLTPLPAERATQLDIDFGLQWVERPRLILHTTGSGFFRSVRVDGGGTHTIYRLPGQESLTLAPGAIDPRKTRLIFYHGDNQPVSIDEVVLEAPVRRVEFPAPEAGRYYLLLGRKDAAAPSYDLAQVLARQPARRAGALGAGAFEANPAYVPPPVPPKPVTERFPWLLPSILAVAVLGMGYGAFKLLRSVG